MDFMYYSYCRKFTGREFFVPAQTPIVVKLLKGTYFTPQARLPIDRCSSRCIAKRIKLKERLFLALLLLLRLRPCLRC